MGRSDFTYYGYNILSPKHDWPHMAALDNGWYATDFVPCSEKILLHDVDFHRYNDGRLEDHVRVPWIASGQVNAVRITSVTGLTEEIEVGATNALNGDKILAIMPIHAVANQTTELVIRKELGGGLASFSIRERGHAYASASPRG